jgi:hypothetical protein
MLPTLGEVRLVLAFQFLVLAYTHLADLVLSIDGLLPFFNSPAIMLKISTIG